MCGLTGFLLSKSLKSENSLYEYLTKMTNSLKHRGPDASGFWYCTDSNIFLGHRRLSIIDLSSNGEQPMHSNNNRFVMIFNGEIYNYRELKLELMKNFDIKFKNNTDTQVLLESINSYGLDRALRKIEGMFAFALWDKTEKCLFLVRDRIGKKPLYWGRCNEGIIFGSEIKSILKYDNLNKSLDQKSISAFLKFSYINSPNTIFKNISKVEPGHYIKFINNKLEKTQYWNLNHFIKKKKNIKTDSLIESEVENLIEDATVKRLVSDVPLGIMLSGGIDSSLITALAQKNLKSKLKTFSVKFEEKDFDESGFAREIAKILGTEHHEIDIGDFSIKKIIDEIPRIYDEPFADSSQIPTFLISQELKKSVTVALSGDGGDEIFCGYSRYFWASNFSKLSKFISPKILKIISNSINLVSSRKINMFTRFLNKGTFPPQLGDRLKKIAKILHCNSDNQIYSTLVSQTDPNKYFKIQYNHEKEIDLNTFPGNYNIQEAMQYIDIKTYLPGDILVKVDRASMANGLEVRSPFLDHRIVEYALENLSNKQKIQWGKGKFILRKILSKYLPKKLINRPKMGFGVPLSNWLRNELRDWMLDTLEENKIKNQGFLNHNNIKNLIISHLKGSHNHHYELWPILMFQSWYDKWMK
tara:strand:+ start:1885 stop:3810 length:1926 start_codon:yes stop_codon:yes gene_type:complete